MKINYALRESEYKQFVSKSYMDFFKKRKIWGIVFVCVLLINMSWGVHSIGDLISTILPFVLLVGLWMFILKMVSTRLFKNEQQRELALGNQSVELLDEYILYTTETSVAQLKWKSVSELKETDKCIYLVINQVSTIIVPKRVFANESEVTNFKQIVERNMPSK